MRRIETPSAGPRRICDLFQQHRRHIYRRALHLMGDPSDAEDVVQDVFVKALDGPRLAGREMLGWLYRVTTNRCFDLLRGRNRRRALMQSVVEPAIVDRVEPRPDEALTLRWLLAHAEPRQVEIAVLVHVDGLPAERAAERIGVSRRTAFNLLDRLRAWARSQLAAPVGDAG